MAVITIARELAALGDETAKELEKRTGYNLIGKHILEEKIREAGLTEAHLEKYDEKKPAFIDSLSAERDDYLRYLKQVMFNEASKGSCIFVGRGASAVFSNIPGVLSVFLSSSMSTRVARVKSYFRCDEKRARIIIDRSDADRTGFYKYFFEGDWKAPDNYHITLNTSRIPPAVCADTIASLEKDLFNGESAAASEIKLREMLEACNIVNYVLYVKKIAVHFPEAAVRKDEVVLYGVANSVHIAEAACAAAGEISGGKNIITKIQIVQEFPVLPKMM